jgi:hypothetical protein
MFETVEELSEKLSDPASAATAQTQEANALKEASLAFIRTPDQGSSSHEDGGNHLPVLQLQAGTRIQAGWKHRFRATSMLRS